MKLLTVDDDPLFLDLMAAELRALGYTDIHQAASGEEALDLVARATQPFDCFILDINMPGMDGIALCSALRRMPKAAQAPIVMLTARAESHCVEQAFAAGATDYLTKPLNRTELRGRMGMVARVVRQGAAGVRPQIGIDDPLPLTDVPACIDYLALQNYLLKLGAMRSLNRAVACIRVDNIDDIFATKAPGDFADTLLDIAEMIVEALGPGQKLVSYAGSGHFLAVVGRRSGFEPDDLAFAMEPLLATLSDWYAAAGEIAPKLHIGPAVTRGVFSFVAPDDLIDQARAAVARHGIPVRRIPTQMRRSA